MIQIKSRDMDFRQTLLLLACFSLLASSFSVHANLLLPRRFGDITPYSEETPAAADVSASTFYSASASSPKSAPTPPPRQSASTLKSRSTPSKDKGSTAPPPARLVFNLPSVLGAKFAATKASLLHPTADDSAVTSGLRSSNAGDEILSTATKDAVNAVKAAAAAAGAGSVDPKVLKFCAISDTPDACINSILPIVRSSSSGGRVDPMIILQKEIKAGIKEAKKTINRLAVVGAKHNITDQMDTCRENYKSALKSFQEAMEAVPKKDLGRITSVLSGAITHMNTCDDAFAEKSTLHSPLGSHFAAHLKDLADISLEIANKWVPDDH